MDAMGMDNNSVQHSGGECNAILDFCTEINSELFMAPL